jgi:glycosyltransferase involved in cell wall biosynthesis
MRFDKRGCCMDKISVIIPVYNVAPYIRKCLDSVINQTYKNLEIILVNDGSTDKSGSICDEYKATDKRIQVFSKKNGGVSSAKNIGLNNATGKYIGFVDSDDWVEPDMYENMYNAAEKNNVQISVCGYYKNNNVIKNKTTISQDIITTENMLLYPLKRDYYMGFCGYTWNKLFLADVMLKFDESIHYGEDVLLYSQIVLKGDCIGTFIDKPLYHYRQRNDSIANSKSIETKKDILKVYKIIEESFIKCGFSDISYWARGFYCHHASVIAEIAIQNNDKKTLKSAQNEMIYHLDEYKKTNKEFPEKLERIDRLLSK